ncbi:MAG: DUF2442 domain-containing protein [Acidobacteriota bacterium]
MEATPRIDTVRAIGPTRLLIRFRNGEQKVYDCGALVCRAEFQLLASPAFFRAVRLDAGGYGISWNDDIDLSEYELWTNGEAVTDLEPCPSSHFV